MRSLFRFVAPVIAAGAIVLAGSTAALAATSKTDSLDANWCFDDVVVLYCFDVTGTVKYVDGKAGSSVTVHQRTVTTYYEGGVYAGESRSVEMLRGVFQNDGTVTMTVEDPHEVDRVRRGLQLSDGPQDRRLRDGRRPREIDLRRLIADAPAHRTPRLRVRRSTIQPRSVRDAAVRGTLERLGRRLMDVVPARGREVRPVLVEERISRADLATVIDAPRGHEQDGDVRQRRDQPTDGTDVREHRRDEQCHEDQDGHGRSLDVGLAQRDLRAHDR